MIEVLPSGIPSKILLEYNSGFFQQLFLRFVQKLFLRFLSPKSFLPDSIKSFFWDSFRNSSSNSFGDSCKSFLGSYSWNSLCLCFFWIPYESIPNFPSGIISWVPYKIPKALKNPSTTSQKNISFPAVLQEVTGEKISGDILKRTGGILEETRKIIPGRSPREILYGTLLEEFF